MSFLLFGSSSVYIKLPRQPYGTNVRIRTRELFYNSFSIAYRPDVRKPFFGISAYFCSYFCSFSGIPELPFTCISRMMFRSRHTSHGKSQRFKMSSNTKNPMTNLPPLGYNEQYWYSIFQINAPDMITSIILLFP